MEKNSSFTAAIHHRRSVRVYDENKEIDAEIVKNCIQLATLAPNSSNMQLYEFHHITSSAILDKLSVGCLGQSTATTAKQLVVVVVRKDLWKQRAKANIDHLNKLFGAKSKSEYTPREKFAMNYYKKLIPFVYSEFLGIFGYLKYFISWLKGIFKPSYRQLRNSDMRIVAHKSAGLAAQTFMLCMASEGYDTCPIEGSDSLRIKKNIEFAVRK